MIFRFLDRLLDAMLFVVLLTMSAVVFANVFCRFVLNFSLYWGDETAQGLLVWLTFLGAAVAVRDRSHYTFDYLTKLTRGTLQLVVGVLSRLITIAAIVGLLVWSTEVAFGIRPWIMPALRISRVWLYAAGPIGCTFMLLYAVRDLMRIFREHRVVEEPTALGT